MWASPGTWQSEAHVDDQLDADADDHAAAEQSTPEPDALAGRLLDDQRDADASRWTTVEQPARAVVHTAREHPPCLDHDADQSARAAPRCRPAPPGCASSPAAARVEPAEVWTSIRRMPADQVDASRWANAGEMDAGRLSPTTSSDRGLDHTLDHVEQPEPADQPRTSRAGGVDEHAADERAEQPGESS